MSRSQIANRAISTTMPAADYDIRRSACRRRYQHGRHRAGRCRAALDVRHRGRPLASTPTSRKRHAIDDAYARVRLVMGNGDGVRQGDMTPMPPAHAPLLLSLLCRIYRHWSRHRNSGRHARRRRPEIIGPRMPSFTAMTMPAPRQPSCPRQAALISRLSMPNHRSATPFRRA